MALNLSISGSLAEATKMLGRQGLDVLPHIAPVLSTADEFARLAKTAMATDLAKRAVLLARENPTYSAEDAIRKAWEKHQETVKAAFDTNLRIAYQAGRHKRAMADKDATMLLLRSMQDKRVRPTHQALDGVLLLKTHAFWKTHLPPMGYRCRCKTLTIAPDDLGPHLGKVQGTPPKEAKVTYVNKYTGKKETVPASIDPGWLIDGESPVHSPLKALQAVNARKEAELIAAYEGRAVKYPKPAPKPRVPKEPKQKDLPLPTPAPADPKDSSKWGHEDFIKAGAAIRARHFPQIPERPVGPGMKVLRDGYKSLFKEYRANVPVYGKLDVVNAGAVAPQEDKLQWAIRSFPKAWIEKADKFAKAASHPLQVQSKPGQRAYYLHSDRLVMLSDTGGADTAVHEFGHHLQRVMPRMDRLVQDWVRARTKGEELKRLSEITGNSAYDDREVAKKDKFFNAYIGKAYEGDSYREGVSMGFEHLLGGTVQGFEKPTNYALLKFNQMLARDTEMFDLFVGLLFHYAPG